MKVNAKDPNVTLEAAALALRSHEPSPEAIAASRARLEAQLFGQGAEAPTSGPIQGCEAVESLLVAYRRGELNAPRALLVRHHLSECAQCREVFARRGSLRLATTPWKRDSELAHDGQSGHPARSRTQKLVWLLAAASFCVVAFLSLRSFYFGVPSGLRASVESVSGVLYRVDGSRVQRLEAGAELAEGQVVRAGAEPQSLLRLADGSVVEMGERAEFSVAMRGRDTTLRLNRGQVIVQAAKRRTGHLYVAARDCRVAVTGTVFSVTAALKGSRVSVIEGEVHVTPSSGREQVLSRGQQLTTTPGIAQVPIEQEIAWSRNLDDHLALLREMTHLGKAWKSIPGPRLRYDSQLTRLVPDDTAVYAALPNYAEIVGEGYRLFKSRLNDSTVLQQWWKHVESGNRGIKLDDLMAKMHDLSEYLGDEVVIAGSVRADEPEIVVMAEIKRQGLAPFVETEMRSPGGVAIPLTVVDELGAVSLNPAEISRDGEAILLVTARVAALSSSPRAIAAVATRLALDEDSAFATSRLGERLSQAYRDGVSVVVAADLEALAASTVEAQRSAVTERPPAYVIFERRDVLDQTFNRGELVFNGPRQGLASWLAEPGPMGSLDFLTTEASAVGAFLVKRPAEVLNDITRTFPNAGPLLNLGAAEQEFAEALGNEVALALDGPIFPIPAWKLVIEVKDAARLERGLEALLRRVDQTLRDRHNGSLNITQERAGEHTLVRVTTRDASLPIEVDYTIVDGYLVMAPSRALLGRALQAHSRGDTLGRSRRFLDRLPRDGRATLSGFLFQDLLGVVVGAIGNAGTAMTPVQRQQLELLQSGSEPTLIGFYAGADRIEMATVGDLFPLGPEALALPGLVQQIFPESLLPATK